MRVKLICATTADGFIARDANEKTKWTNDLALFKEQTMGKPVIMGSHTFNSMENIFKPACVNVACAFPMMFFFLYVKSKKEKS